MSAFLITRSALPCHSFKKVRFNLYHKQRHLPVGQKCCEMHFLLTGTVWSSFLLLLLNYTMVSGICWCFKKFKQLFQVHTLFSTSIFGYSVLMVECSLIFGPLQTNFDTLKDSETCSLAQDCTLTRGQSWINLIFAIRIIQLRVNLYTAVWHLYTDAFPYRG